MKLAYTRFVPFLVLFTLCGTVRAATFTVTNTGDNGGVNPAPGTGTGTLRQAIVDADNANGSDTIAFDTSVKGTIALSSALPSLQSSLTIQGPGATALTVSGGDKVRVFTITGRVSLAGLTIAHGKANSSDSLSLDAGGGGILNDHGALTLANCVLSNNQDGGLDNDGTDGSVTAVADNCTFTNNAGDGLHNSGFQGSAVARMTNCIFDHNKGNGFFNDGTGSKLDAPFYKGAQAILSHCSFTSNGQSGLANTSGGMGIESVLVDACSFTHNKGSAGHGGGIDNDDGEDGSSYADVTNSSFIGNAADYGGGIFDAELNGEANMTVTNCFFTQNSATTNGGGVYNATTQGYPGVSLRHCIFARNTASSGGGFYNDGSGNGASAILYNCAFTANNATTGGGFSNQAGQATLNNCTFSANMATDGGGFSSDGVYAIAALNNCAFNANRATTGGAFSNAGATAQLNHCVLTANVATYGGGLCNADSGADDGIVQASDCVFIRNSAPGGMGGGLYNIEYSGDGTTIVKATLARCAFIANVATKGAGGGLYNNGENGPARMDVSDCTFARNSAAQGGGCFNDGPTSSGINPFVIFSSCTFARNSATQGGGLYNQSSETAAIARMDDTILASNAGGNLFSAPDLLTSKGYNLSSDAAGGDAGTGPGGLLNGPGDIRNTDPKLDPKGARNNGGLTPTIALQSGSSAINAGDPAFKSPPGPRTDQRGRDYARVYGGRLDIGAFEVQPLCDLALNSAASINMAGTNAQVTYTLTLSNSGPDMARGITLNDDLPSYTTFVAFTQTGGPAFALTHPMPGGPSRVTAKVSALASGATSTFKLVLNANTQATLINTATAATITPEADLTNNSTSSRLILDHTPPTVSITTPQDNSMLNRLDLILGRAGDTPGGTGVRAVTVSIKRIGDNKYFDGTAFVTPPVVNGTAQLPVLATNYDPQTGIWTRRKGLPNGADLQPGKYEITATAIDDAGNRSEAISDFTVPAPISTVTLSSATVSAATQSITLRFNTALEADAASDATHYTVEVNGRAVPAQSASYNARNFGVTLSLAEGTLHSGDKVTVRWSGLRDGQGNSIAGSTEIVAE